MSLDNTPSSAVIALPDPSEPLESPLKEQFCLTYASQPRGKQAAITAGYKARNAASTACHLLKEPIVSNRISYLRKTFGWTKERLNFEVNDGYEEAKRLGNLKERREFAIVMARIMGLWETSREGGATFILQNCQVRLESYNQSYRTHAQIIDTKEVKGFVALEVAPNNQQVIGRNDAESNKISARGMDSPPTGSM